MLIFKKISWQNLLSTGSAPNTFILNSSPSTLIAGKNASGKSTILCALTFVLFGKPFRNITKPQLVNSINNKNCLVEIEFSINNHEYIVKRGIKPNVFEIFCDGNLINQDAATKDYQKVLEQQILKLNYKTFTQVVILGSATFVPFMQLPALQRRDVIEDILDIRVFSDMNSILKEKIALTKDQISKVESDIHTQKIKIESQKKLIEVLKDNKQNTISSLQNRINTNNEQITETQNHIDRASKKLEELHKKYNLDEITDAITSTGKIKASIMTNIKTSEQTKEFFDKNTICPTCSQDIAEDHKARVLQDIEDKNLAHYDKARQIDEIIEKLNKKFEDANSVKNQIDDITIDISNYKNKIKLLSQQNDQFLTEINSINDDHGCLQEEEDVLKSTAKNILELVNEKTKLLELKELHNDAAMLLKDTGIKTAIIKEYLPIMNRLINKYLNDMDLNISFELDESFQEVIKSRNRDIFTYSSFSEGEKRRIDLSILFAWRQIAKMKNSVNTNLLFLDEILDSSLDNGGIDYFLSMMNSFGDNTNVFVISHRSDQVIDKFDNVVKVEKRKDFSVILS